jgi:hypothetical protein
LFVGFAVAATIAGQGVSEEQVSHWAEASGGRQAALTFLVSAKWTEGEAQERNVVVTQAEAERAVGEEPSRGLTHNDMVYKARLTLLTAGIREQIATPAAQSVTPEQVDAYVRGHPRTRPVRRRMHILQARTRHQAARAKDKIANGLTWRTAARRYGISGGARQKTVWPGDYDLNVEEALFKARINRLTRYGERGRPARPPMSRCPCAAHRRTARNRANPKYRARNSYIRRTSRRRVAEGFRAAYGRTTTTFRRGLGAPCL